MANKRPELTALEPSTIREEDLARLPEMTGWFDPILLAKLLLRVIISDVFGQYADRRLISAALDPLPEKNLVDRLNVPGFNSKDGGAVWFDYVADLGDGFDATYAIAYLLAQPELQVEGYKQALPRGNPVITGGDQVYPTATRDDYNVKMRLPYSLALPDKGGESHPSIFLIPGNHDWYDGLVNFLAIFCRNKPTPIGDWRSDQRRSYFGVKLNDNWWVWGIDIALVRDMDQPQADYFVAIAKQMRKGANIILCSAEPGWYKAAEDGDSFRTLTYAARIAEHAEDEQGEVKDLKIPLVLSGDSHHYAHYFGAGTHYITSGGGGAFLHGTLELEPEIKAKWLKDEDAALKLETCYPTKEESRRLLDGNKSFGARNPELTWALATVYLIYSFALTLRPHLDVVLIEFFILGSGIWAYSRYQEGYNSAKVVLVAGAQALAHMLIVGGISLLALWISRWFFSSIEWHWFFWLIYLALFAFTLGRWVAGHIFGWSLLITCRYFDMNHNDAFSAMRLDSHRHFLRLRIVGETVTVFPIKIDKVPTRDQWQENPERAKNPLASVFRPNPAMQPGLIEAPIEIRAQHARPTSEVKTPSELPPQP
jgi:hypothetical protein